MRFGSAVASAVVALALLGGGVARAATPSYVSDPASYVDPFVGTGSGGPVVGSINTFPGPAVPFGMIQWSPDTGHYSGYYYGDSQIKGFSLTHLSGVGCAAMGDVPLLPTSGDIGSAPWNASAGFSHDDEKASPGSYSVHLQQGMTPVPSSALAPPDGGAQHGLRGDYYGNMDFGGSPAVTRVDPQVAFDWGEGAPADGVPADRFSVRWTGTLTAPATGDYQLGTTSDDGSRLYLDGQLLVDNWGDHGPATKTATVHLVAGESHTIRMDYYENQVGATAMLVWQPPNGATGIDVALTSANRAAIGQFTYPRTTQANMLIKAGDSLSGNDASSVRIVDDHTVVGSSTSGHFCGAPDTYTVYFAASFDHPFSSYGTWSGSSLHPGDRSADAKGRTGAYVTFDAGEQPLVQAKVAISFVSEDAARANLAAELPGWDFDTVRRQAHDAWDKILSRVRIGGGTDAQRTTFYTALYHALLHPNVFSDEDGRYIGFDQQIHRAAAGHAEYANYSGWDIYRSEVPLLALLAPHETSDMMQSLVDDAAQGGWLPKWPLANGYTGVMNGDAADPIIAGAYAFGARDFDVPAALAAMVKGATQTGSGQWGYVERPQSEDYQRLGYVPNTSSSSISPVHNGASETLEYAIDDFSIAQLARALGDGDTYGRFAERGQSWQALFNPGTGYLQPRDGEGLFPSGPAFQVQPGQFGQDGYQEGNAAQYTWMVPHNPGALITAMGGPDQAASRLDDFFGQLNAGPDEPYEWAGNEICFGVPYLYDYARRPYRTQAVVRRIVNDLYGPTPDGAPGNDDLAAMSSWYVWSALGLYPATPGVPELVLASPLFPAAQITLASGQTLTIHAPAAAADAPYVQGLTRDGKPWEKAWLPPSVIRAGGTLDFALGSSPDRGWAADAAAAPHSYTDGQAQAIGFTDPSPRVTLAPGESADVTLGAQDVTASAHTVSWSADVPSGLELSRDSGTIDVPAGGAGRVRIVVSAPADAQEGFHEIAFRLRGDDGVALPEVDLQVAVAKPGSLLPYFDNTGISDDSDPGAADFDGVGYSYSEQALTAAGLAPGSTKTVDGITYSWPDVAAGTPDNIVAQGQTIRLSGDGSRLGLLGSATNAPQAGATGTATITYADGSREQVQLTLSDWALGGQGWDPAPGDTTVASMPYRNGSAGRQGLAVHVFATSVALAPGKTVRSITLPDDGRLHVFAVATG